jgi:hypothetical protein
MTSWIEGQTKPPAPRAKEVARNSSHLHLGPPYKTNMSSPGPGLRLERPKATPSPHPPACC